MAIQSGFFNSVNGDRRYDAKWFAQYFASFIANGIFPNPSTGLQVVEGDNMTTVVKAGKGWINGYFIVSDSDYILQHDNADGVLKRIDRVVMRLNNLTRQIEIVVKKGIFASSPATPVLQRDGDYYELALADVLINNGSTQITQANITDTRLNKELCGIVHGLVDQVDTTTIFNQYQSFFEEWSVEQKQAFEQWLASLGEILEGDAAANLANRILLIEEQIGTETLQTTAKTLKGAINEVFQTGNNVKSNTVDALLSVDGSLPITSDDVWSYVIAQIGNISTGKKSASGIANASQTTLNYNYPGGSSYQTYHVTVSDDKIDFIPSMIIVSSTSVGTYAYFSVYLKDLLINGTNYEKGVVLTFNYHTTSPLNNAVIHNFKKTNNIVSTTQNFSIPFITNGQHVNWLAIE